MRLDALRCSLGSKQRVKVAFLFVGDRSLVVRVNRVYSNCFVSKIARVYFCELHFVPGQTTFYTARTCLAQRATLKNWEWPGYEARFNGEFIFGEFKFGDFKSDRQIAKFKSSPNFPDIRYVKITTFI